MLNYEVYNNEKNNWIVFVHGIGGSTLTWKKQIDDFSQHYNLLLLDLHGHGKSKEQGKVSVKLVNEEIKEVLDYLHIDKADFVGMSLGTIVIAQFAVKYPKYVNAIIFGGAVLQVDGIYKFAMRIANKIKYILPKRVTYRMFANILIPAKWHKKSRSIFLRESKKLTRKTFLSWMKYTSISIKPKEMIDKLKKLNIKIFFISGDHDTCFIKSVKKIVNNMKTAKLEVFKDCGHVCTIEKSNQFNKSAISFLNVCHQRA